MLVLGTSGPSSTLGIPTLFNNNLTSCGAAWSARYIWIVEHRRFESCQLDVREKLKTGLPKKKGKRIRNI
jgi:hypothetical protein